MSLLRWWPSCGGHHRSRSGLDRSSPELRYSLAWLVVICHLVIPASYYLWRHDRDDERFAWRMFSAVRFDRCEVVVRERLRSGNDRPVALSRQLHASWVTGLRRGRIRIVERALSERCVGAVRSATLLRTCSDVLGERLPESRFVYDCERRALEAIP